MASAYSAGASGWEAGPARLYSRLAELLVEFSPLPLDGRLVLDLGSGTGAGSFAALSVGGRVIAADLSLGMLQRHGDRRPPAAVADALALPFTRRTFDVVLAAFSLNHLDDPAAGVRESGRVGDLLLASTYAADDDHPVKAAVEKALSEVGWVRPAWYAAINSSRAACGTVDSATATVERGGMQPLLVELREIAFTDLTAADMVAWRLGLAHSAGFVEALDYDVRQMVSDRAVVLLGPDPPPVVRRVIFLAASAAASDSGAA